MRSRILFIATTSDLIALMTSIEAQRPLKYTLTGFPDQPDLRQTQSFKEIEDFGISKFGNIILEESFLLSDPSLEIRVEPVPQNKGGIKYRIYTELNSKTLLLRPGGMFQDNTVIAGELMKYSDEQEAREMFKLFQQEVKRQFKKHETYPYWLGQQAAAMHAAGCRLTNDVKSPFSLSQ
jgi:hypothetical protein